MTTSLGAKIKRHRQEKGYSLDKLAELTDSSKSYLWELENRDTRKPSGEKLTRIAQALEVTTDYLLDDSEEPGDEDGKDDGHRSSPVASVWGPSPPSGSPTRISMRVAITPTTMRTT